MGLSITTSVSAPLFYLSVRVILHPETPLLWWEAHQSSLPTASFITSWSTRWVHARQLPWGGCWEGPRGHGDWQWLLKIVCVSSPCVESLCHPCLTAVCLPWWHWYQHSVGRIVGTWVPGDRPQMSLAQMTPYSFFIFKVDQVGFLPWTTKISVVLNKTVFCFQSKRIQEQINCLHLDNQHEMNICQLIFSYSQLSSEDVCKELLIRRPVWLSLVTTKGCVGTEWLFEGNRVRTSSQMSWKKGCF